MTATGWDRLNGIALGFALAFSITLLMLERV